MNKLMNEITQPHTYALDYVPTDPPMYSFTHSLTHSV